MEETIAAFVTHMSSQHASANTCGAYATDLRQLAKFLRAHKINQWTAVSRDHLAAYLGALREQYKATTVNRKLAAFKRFFQWLGETGALANDPTAGLSAPRATPERAEPVSSADVEKLLSQVTARDPIGLRDRAMLYLLAFTGVQVSEAISLDTTDINFDRQPVVYVGRTKKSRRPRVLQLDPATLDALREYRDAGRHKLVHNKKEHALFVNHHGMRLTRQGLWLIVTSHAQAAGVKGITPQTLRQTYASNKLAHGAELRVVQELLGHASITTTQMYRPTARGGDSVSRSRAPLHA
jgi:integrase/recombinase XerD